jgi:hypothetical protein
VTANRNVLKPLNSAGCNLDRRRFSAMLLSAAVLPIDDLVSALRYPLYDAASARVLPKGGHRSLVSLGDAVVKLVENGAIDRGKFFQLYRASGGFPAELYNVLLGPSRERITLTLDNANYYLNLLWPLGLSNHMAANLKSPINGGSLNSFASTGGWTLGQEENGAVYFNKLSIVPLTPDQEVRVVEIAKSTYRPCCNNSTFFQDCNHGSALLGLLELGASQGLSDQKLYREALAFNSFWFPDAYVQTALYFELFDKLGWDRIDPRLVLGFDYSALSAWKRNVAVRLAAVPGLVPGRLGGAACGV